MVLFTPCSRVLCFFIFNISWGTRVQIFSGWIWIQQKGSIYWAMFVSSYCCQSPNVHCDLKGESLELVACTMTKGKKFSFFVSFILFLLLSTNLGGGELSQKCDSPWLILLLNANCKCHVAMGEAGHLTFVSNLRGQLLWPKKYAHSRPFRKKAGHGDGVLGAAAA